MTSESASQSIAPGRADDIPPSFDERTALTTFLDYARDFADPRILEEATGRGGGNHGPFGEKSS
jgi:hypothetical protein